MFPILLTAIFYIVIASCTIFFLSAVVIFISKHLKLRRSIKFLCVFLYAMVIYVTGKQLVSYGENLNRTEMRENTHLFSIDLGSNYLFGGYVLLTSLIPIFFIIIFLIISVFFNKGKERRLSRIWFK